MKIFIPILMLTLSSHSYEEIPSHNGRIGSLREVELAEEACSAKGAFCCRISGNLLDISGSIIAYATAALAGASVIDTFPEHVRKTLALAAGIGGLATGILLNLKPTIDRIAREKQARAEALQKKYSRV
ncbi:hypothetical protein [Candidatus Odyssella acanthamoebae]|uniref:Uncharacterized protein n=1 Tax=Candidatus Odyssella acanthamoebae TaxID=91604 RepID=A0A077AV17_9PROT|nr:hypothetical protein [Candidatus Paracaedibacter acanthamoebae]AIK95899.1 hypothetical protein ID47_02850 [Candidatus Paracaedibacter acanthamoebae]